MERQSKASRGLEVYCEGGQGPPRTVAPPKKKEKNMVLFLFNNIIYVFLLYDYVFSLYVYV